MALEVPSGAGRQTAQQTCCLAQVPPQGLAIVQPLTPFVLFGLPTTPPPHPPSTPPPSSPVSCPAGAADLWPIEAGSAGLETIEDFSSYLYNFVLSVHLTAYFGTLTSVCTVL